MTGSRRPLGELLVERGAASPSTVQVALRRQRRDPRHLGDHLLDLGVPEAEILAALGEQIGRTPVDLDRAEIGEDALLTVDASFARTRGVVPLRLDAPVVQIVDLLLTQGLRDRASDVRIEPQAATPSATG